MNKPRTYYVLYPYKDLAVPVVVMDCVTKPLANSGVFKFRSDSEIFTLCENESEKQVVLYAGVAPIGEDGLMTAPPTCHSMYFNTRDGQEQFHARNMDLYLAMIGRGEDILPVVRLPKEYLPRQATTLHHQAHDLKSNMVLMGWERSVPVLTGEAQEWLRQRETVENAQFGEQMGPIARLWATYTEANPDPCERLAVISGGRDAILKRLVPIAEDFSELVEIRSKGTHFTKKLSAYYPILEF